VDDTIAAMEVAEARQVLEAGRPSTGYRQWQQVVDLLEPVHRAQLLTGHEQAEAAFLVGQAQAWLGAWDKAGPYLDEAVQYGDRDVQQQAAVLRDQALHEGVAVLAEQGGVDANEAMLVLVAADEALARQDYATASGHYERVYNGQAPGDRATAALGIARCRANTGQFVEATQYAGYAASIGSADIAEQANKLLEWLSQQQDVAADASDGSTPDEYKRTWDAAQEAMFSGSYEHARTLFRSLAEGTNIADGDRAWMQFRVAVLDRVLGDRDAARMGLEIAEQHADAELRGKIANLRGMMDREIEAAALVAELLR
jgi:hypothetical protein